MAPGQFGARDYTRVIGRTNLNLAACLSRLACPVCGSPLAERDRAASCEARHSFDFARSGYLNLMVGRGGRGRTSDTAGMVSARAEILGRGYFDPLAEAIARCAHGPLGVAAEIGAGTGHYLARLDAGGRIAIDLSKPAAAQAARAHPGMLSVVADVEEGIPLLDGAADVLLSVFAPRPAAEVARVVRPGGAFVAALGTERHLARLRRDLGLIGVHPGKAERLQERLADWFEPERAETVEFEIELSAEDVPLLVAMGPNARHAGAPAADRPRREVVSVDVLGFRRLDTAPPHASK